MLAGCDVCEIKWQEIHMRLNGGRNFNSALQNHQQNTVVNRAADTHLYAASYELNAASECSEDDAGVIRFGAS
jgi:hypothetical protein